MRYNQPKSNPIKMKIFHWWGKTTWEIRGLHKMNKFTQCSRNNGNSAAPLQLSSPKYLIDILLHLVPPEGQFYFACTSFLKTIDWVTFWRNYRHSLQFIQKRCFLIRFIHAVFTIHSFWASCWFILAWPGFCYWFIEGHSTVLEDKNRK